MAVRTLHSPTRRPRRDRVRVPIYMDNHATTRLDPRVFEAMVPYFLDEYGNPASQHRFGAAAAAAVDRARAQVADAIGASPSEIIFTSGATESLNLALQGLMETSRSRGQDHIVTVQTEHKAVLDTCRHLERTCRARVTYVRPRSDGLLDLATLAGAIEPQTAVVSVMAANNEIGVLQPLDEIGALCRDRGVVFLTDAAQAIGKVPVDVEATGIDLLALSGHKVHGPKGVGALYVRKRARAAVMPLLHGGGQERGMRAGTIAVPLVVGLGEALCIAVQELPEEAERVRLLRDRLWTGLAALIPGLMLNGHARQRLPGNLNVCFPEVEADAIVAAVDDVAVSLGAACSSSTIEPSHVLRSIGLTDEKAMASLRFGLGRFTTLEDVDYAMSRFSEAFAAVSARSRAASATIRAPLRAEQELSPAPLGS